MLSPDGRDLLLRKKRKLYYEVGNCPSFPGLPFTTSSKIHVKTIEQESNKTTLILAHSFITNQLLQAYT